MAGKTSSSTSKASSKGRARSGAKKKTAATKKSAAVPRAIRPTAKRVVKKKPTAKSKTTAKKKSAVSKRSASSLKTKVAKPKPKAKARGKSKPTAKKRANRTPRRKSIEVIEMEVVETVKGELELPKRRRGRPTRQEEELRAKILAEHGIKGDPTVRRPRGRPRKGMEPPPSPAKRAETDRIDKAFNTPEIQAKVRDLIKLAKEQDYLTYDDVNDALPAGASSPELLDSVMTRLSGMGFDVIDASEVDKVSEIRQRKESDDEAPPKADTKLDILDDPVRMYLKQMGQVPLLTREEEVAISKRIEDAEKEAHGILHRFGYAADLYVGVAERLLEGKERFDRVISDKEVNSRERYIKGLNLTG